MTLLDRHAAFLASLRGAGVGVSLAEGLDAVDALSVVGWSSREQVREVYAATTIKKANQRETFDALFEIYFPRMVGSGVAGSSDDASGAEADTDPNRAAADAKAAQAQVVGDLQQRLAEMMEAGDEDGLRAIAAEAMARLGALPGRGNAMSNWSSYTALRRLDASAVVSRLVDALQAEGWGREEAERAVSRRIGTFTRFVEEDSRRRIAEDKGPDHIADATIRPTLERLDFLSARRSDLESLRREIYPLARRLATRLAQEHHAGRRGAVDMRRTVRASLATGGVPVDLRYRPRRPHRTDLVVLCDVSGSVANFAQFTLMLVFALREVFGNVRAFTFVDDVTEVTSAFRAGRDLTETMTELAQMSAHAARFGRTNYGSAFTSFRSKYVDALGPRSSLLILGDARSNYSDLHLDALRDLAGRTRHAHWLNPERRRNWDTGDSVATRYGAVVEMHECRNLTQLSGFVHDLA